jgi:hypothetical protein
VGQPLKRRRSTLSSGGYMKTLMAILFSLFFGPSLMAQTSQQPKPESTPGPSITRQQIVDLPLPKRGFHRPSLTLQTALKIAEGYVAKQKIDTSHYYLFEAKYILYGSKDNQDPSWFFWWVNENGVIGDYVEIVVSIKTGNVLRVPSM